MIIAVVGLLQLLYLGWNFLIYPIFFSPLSKIPAAHPLARITSWWITYIRWSRRELRTIHASHQKYGPIILLGPEEISVNCVKGGIQTVYSGGFEKGGWYDIFANFDGVLNMFSMNPSKQHGARKRILSNIYSKSYLQKSATLAEVTRTILFDRFLPRLDTYAKEGRDVEIYSDLYAITMDMVTNYQFGLASGSNFIQDVSFREKYLGWYSSRVGFNFWPQECPKLSAFLEQLGFQMTPAHIPIANQGIETWCLAMCNAASIEAERIGVAKVEDVVGADILNFPCVYSHMVAGMEKNKDDSIDSDAWRQQTQVASEMLDHLAAGFDTSSITLCYVVHELSLRPDIQKWLRNELLTLDPPLSVQQLRDGTSINPSSKQLDALPILDAVLQETLRLRSAIPGPEPRVTPVGGCQLGTEGQYKNIPGGVRISAQAHSLHRNPEVYEKPEEWNPSRWLDSSDEKLKEMKRWFWAFGSGGRMCVGSNLAIYGKSLPPTRKHPRETS